MIVVQVNSGHFLINFWKEMPGVLSGNNTEAVKKVTCVYFQRARVKRLFGKPLRRLFSCHFGLWFRDQRIFS